MLLRFRVSNYASIRDEQEISLVALDEHRDLAVSPVPGSREHVLPVVGLFGPNASGKSNLIKAAGFARDAVTESHQMWLPEDPIPRWPFRLDDDSRTRPSSFLFEFVLDRVRMEYGFSLDDHKIHEEWLYVWPRGKRQRLFERDSSGIKFGPSLTGPNSMIAEVVRENSLFLSAAAANNHSQLRPIAARFRKWRSLMPISLRNLEFDPRSEPDEKVIELLKFADIGIVGSTTIARSPEEWARTLGRALQDRRQHASTGATSSAGNTPDLDTPRAGSRIEFMHKAATERGIEPLPWHWESAGTQSWLRIAGAAAETLYGGGVLTIDDLGGDLHPLLTGQLVGLFQRPETNPSGAQLIFTSHDVSLLGKQVAHRLRRDQVWLVSKNSTGATGTYPLTEYGRVRDGLDDVEGRYLQGRYGAVPFFDDALLESLHVAGPAS